MRTVVAYILVVAISLVKIGSSKAGVEVVEFDVSQDSTATSSLVPGGFLPGWDEIFASGFDNACSEDSDRDRLANCVETNSGHFVNAANTGTNPFSPDSDGDGIADGDEVLGTLAGLNLPSFGVSPVHRDILIEYDWFDDAIGCAAHSHRPTPQGIALIRNMFSAGQISNPDGVNGINIIQDYGQGGVFIGGNYISDSDGAISDGLGLQFSAYKSANFIASRNGYFHYAILTHNLSVDGQSYFGLGEVFGDDLVAGIVCFYQYDQQFAATVVHELGHNLGLRHGGDEQCNYKPNYNSVMNYAYNGNGDANCDAVAGDGVLDFSYGRNRLLDETNLNENLGVCTSPIVPIDWNRDGILQTSISLDLNVVDSQEATTCGGVLTVLHDYNDWANLRLQGVSSYGGANHQLSHEVVLCNLPVGARH